METELKHKRAESIIHQLIAKYVNEESNKSSFITITRILLNKANTIAEVWVSVYPKKKEEEGLKFLKRGKSRCKNYIKSNSKLRTIPAVRFHIDKGDEHMARIDALTKLSKDI